MVGASLERYIKTFTMIIALLVCYTLVAKYNYAISGTVTPHEEYIAQYRVLYKAKDTQALDELTNKFLKELEEYISKNPKGDEIVQATLNKAIAVGQFGKHQDDESDKLFKKIISDFPNSPLIPEVMFYRGKLLMQGFNEAKREEERAVFLDLVKKYPKHEKASFALAYTAQSYRMAAKDEKKAAEIYNRVLEEYPKTQAALETRHAFIDMAVRNSDPSAGKQVDEYMKIYSESPGIVDADKWAEFLTANIGDSCLRMHDYKRGKKVFETVIEKYGDKDMSWRARWGLGKCEQGLGNKEAALAAYKQVIDKWVIEASAPGPVWISGFVAESIRGTAVVNGGAPDPEIALLFATKYAHTEAAAQIVADVSRRHLYNLKPERFKELTERLLELKTPAALDSYMDNVNIFIDLHWTIISENRKEIEKKFYPLLRSLEYLSSENKDSFYESCFKYADKTKPFEMVNTVHAHYEKQGNSEEVFRCRITTANFYIEKGMYDKAIELARELQKETKDIALKDELIALESRALFGWHKWEEAIPVLKRRLDKAQEPELKAELLCLIGSCHFSLKNFDAAEVNFNEATKISPDSGWSKKSQEYISYMKRIKENFPEEMLKNRG